MLATIANEDDLMETKQLGSLFMPTDLMYTVRCPMLLKKGLLEVKQCERTGTSFVSLDPTV